MSSILLRDVDPQLHRAVKVATVLAGDQNRSVFILRMLAESPEVREAAALTEDMAPSQGQEGE